MFTECGEVELTSLYLDSMAFYSPPLRRKDSIGLCFSCYPEYNIVCRVIFDELNIDKDDLIGFQHLSNNKVIVKFSSSVTFEQFVEENEGRVVDIDNGQTVRILNFSK